MVAVESATRIAALCAIAANPGAGLGRFRRLQMAPADQISHGVGGLVQQVERCRGAQVGTVEHNDRWMVTYLRAPIVKISRLRSVVTDDINIVRMVLT